MLLVEGVYFRRDDYASFWRRAVVDAIDFLVATLIFLVTAMVLVALTGEALLAELVMGTLVATAFGYFVVLKRSRFGTVGYRVCRVRVVGIDGLPPGWFALTLRMVFGFLGPVNWLADITWLATDAHRQALRDKLARTYVVKAGAQPIGKGKIVFRYYEVFLWNLLVREVQIPEEQKA
jgi:uncharacterized RDD family membrane protein YckC